MEQESYTKRSGAANDQGQMFEIKLASLVYLRAINAINTINSADKRFRLATNAAGAGAADDIVLKVRSPDGAWTSLFLQLKHKEDPKSLLALNKPATPQKGTEFLLDPRSKFSLLKYFEAYMEVLEKMSVAGCREKLFEGKIEDCWFVIYTNCQPASDLETCRVVIPECARILLGSDSGETFRFDPKLNQADYDRVFKFLMEGSAAKTGNLDPDKQALDEQDKWKRVASFLQKLLVVCRQPSQGQFNELIIGELLENPLAKCRRSDISWNSLSDCFIKEIKEWCENKDGAILNQQSNLVAIVLAQLTMPFEIESMQLDIQFQSKAVSNLYQSFRSTQSSLVHITAVEGSCRLTGTKLVQTFGRSQFLLFGIKYLLGNLGSVLSIWEKKESKTLVVIMPESDVPIGESFEDVAEKMRAILSVPGSECRAVIVSRETNILTEKLSASLGNRSQRVQDTFEFSQVSELRHKTFTFQGCHVSVEEFLNTISDDGLKCEFLLNVIDTKGGVKVGPALDEDLTYFIPRTLESCILLKPGILQEGLSLTIVYSSVEDLQKILPEFDAQITNQAFEERLKTILPSHFVPDEVNEAVSYSKTSRLGSYDFSRIVLRNGQADEVTALRIRPSKDDSNQRWFLYVGEPVDKEDVATLSCFNNSQHCLRLAGGKLRWTSTSTGNMDVIRRHLDEAAAASLRPETVADVEDRVVLICAEPGMGKTTLTTHLARNTKQAYPGTWLIELALNDNTKLFKDKVHLNCLEFLLAAAKIESPLEKSLFKNALETSGNVCILLDGFDEIAPRFADHCCIFLANLIKTKTRNIWLTSRNTMKEKLENSLKTLSNKLRKFDNDDQRNFFKKYWKYEATLAEDKLEKFIESLVEMTSRAISDRERNLMGVPLQTKMIADVYEHLVTHPASTTTLPEKLNLLDLLDKFFQTKLDIYAEGKLGLKDDATDYDDVVEEIKLKTTKYLMLAALIAILSNDDLRSLDNFETINKKSACFFERIRKGQDKTGIIDSMVNDKPRFVHRVYAEYFVAKWFATNFSEGIVVLRKKLFTANFSVVRDILDRILAKDGCLLHLAVLNGDVQQAETLLNEGNVNVNVRDLGGRTPLHLAAAFGKIQDPREIRRCREILDLLTRHKEVDLNQEDKILLGSPLSYADMSTSLIAVDKLLACNADSSHLLNTKENIKDGELLEYTVSHDLNALVGFYLDATGRHVDSYVDSGFNSAADIYYPDKRLLPAACLAGSLRTATLLVERGSDINRFDKEYQSPFHAACQAGYLPVVEMLFSEGVLAVLGVHPDKESRKIAIAELINRKDRRGDNALVLAATGNHSDVVSFLIDQGADLLTSNQHLTAAAGHETPNALRVLLAAFPVAEERAAYVNSCSEDGKTAVHTAAREGNNVTLDLLLNAGGKLGPGGFREKTTLMEAAAGSKLDTVTHILNLVDELKATGGASGSREDLGDKLHFVNLKDADGMTALHYSVFRKSNLRVTRYLLSQGADFRICDSEGRTFLHQAIPWNDVNDLRTVLEVVPEAERTAFINLVDNKGNNVLHLAAKMGKPCWDSFVFLVNAGVKMTESNKDRETLLMLAAGAGSSKIVECILNNFEESSEAGSKSEYVKLWDTKGRTALHHFAVRNSVELDPDVVRLLLAAVPEADRGGFVNAADNDGNIAVHWAARLGCNDALDLLLNAGGKLGPGAFREKTTLMAAAGGGKLDTVTYILDLVDAHNSTGGASGSREDLGDRLHFINLQDSDGRTALHFSVLGRRNQHATRYLLSLGADFRIRDSEGRLPLHRAFKCYDVNDIRPLLDAVPEAERTAFFNLVDNEGNNSLHLAAKMGKPCWDSFVFIANAGVKMTESNKDRETLLMLAAGRGSSKMVEYILNNFEESSEAGSKSEYVTLWDTKGRTALHHFAVRNSVELDPDVVRLLLAAVPEADRAGLVNAADNDGNIAVHWAARLGCNDALDLLLNAGGKLGPVDFREKTALMAAAGGGKLDTVSHILNLVDAHNSTGGASGSREDLGDRLHFINLQDSDGRTALHFSLLKERNLLVTRYLVSQGADFRIRDSEGRTPLHRAGQCHDVDAVTCLLDAVSKTERAAYIMAGDNDGWSACHLAAYDRHPDVGRYLLGFLSETERDLLVSSNDKDGNSLLHCAALGGCLESVDLVLNAGGKLLPTNHAGRTPLMSAAEHGHFLLVMRMFDNLNEGREGMSKLDYINLRDIEGFNVFDLLEQAGPGYLACVINCLAHFFDQL